MLPGPDAELLKKRLLIFWIIWGAILTGLITIYLVLGRGPMKPAGTADLPVNLAGVVPLFISVIVRWLVLPRATQPGPALVLFVVGLSLAETCGILGIFLGGPYRDSLFVIGLLAITSYVPLFVKRLLEPKGSGFIPNN